MKFMSHEDFFFKWDNYREKEIAEISRIQHEERCLGKFCSHDTANVTVLETSSNLPKGLV